MSAAPARYISRTLEPVVERAMAEFPAVLLTGPRQAGKTTLLRQLLGARAAYVALDLPDVQMAARADPRGFLDLHPPPVILDEVQACPVLLPYLRERIDAQRARSGQYLLTGSQNLLLMEQVTESLAGRAAVLHLLPLSRREAEGQPERPLPWEQDLPTAGSTPLLPDLRQTWASLVRGAYPELVADLGRDQALWYGSYLGTYLERDVRRLRQVGDLSSFQAFLGALAARSAQLLNLSELARDLGLAVNTVKAWLSVLQASHQVLILRPWHANLGKRLVKTPKVYLMDTGLLCHLCGATSWELAAFGPMAGAIFETAVVTELYRAELHRGRRPGLWFWRTSTGREVDLLVEHGGCLVPVEIKASATPNPRMAEGIHALRRELGATLLPGFVVHAGQQRLPLGGGVLALPLGEL